mmetsp:Transcript_69320/g.104553  ORF Transcript_69320/g.104553 Transcript_69320/m.104553 type:complete len:318 (-) Transcript_69320:47-1000(-)
MTRGSKLFLLNLICECEEVKREYKMPPLYAACHTQVIDGALIEQLLADPSIDVNETYFGWTPCHLAIFRKNSQLLKVLLDCPRTDPNIKSKTGATPLIFACATCYYHQNEIQTLLQNSRVDVNIRSQTPALSLFCRECENLKILELFLSKPLTTEGIEDSKGNSVLWEVHSPAILERLLQDDRFNPNCFSSFGEPFLFRVAGNDMPGILLNLMEDERIDVNQKFENQSLLEYVSYNPETVLKVLQSPRLDLLTDKEFKNIGEALLRGFFGDSEVKIKYLFALCEFSGMAPDELYPDESVVKQLTDKIKLSRAKAVNN